MGRDNRNQKSGHHHHQRGRKNFPKRNQNNSWQTDKRLHESDVKIDEFISDCKGFHGIIKCRYSDFQVNEIDLDGNKAVLTTFDVPEKEEEPILPEAQAASIADFIDEEKVTEINNLIAQSDAHKSVLVDVSDFDKDKRSLFHQVLRKEFGKKTSNNTITTEIGKKYIQLKKFSKGDQSKDNRGWPWPHDYTYFVMFKENIDTIQAVSFLAKNMKIKPTQLVYAGTKDRRAKTSQWICIKKYEPYRISQAARRTQGVKVGNFKFLPNPLKLGDLTGNRFRIALRAVKGDEVEIEKSLKSLQEFGFINYYGLQRFGNSTEVTTFDVGKALLKSEFQEAVDLILKERDGEPDDIKKMRKCWKENRDANEALKYIDKHSMTIEAKLLRALAKSKNDYLQALLQLPRNMLMLYTHSYQSLIFNTLASKRRQLGLQVMDGDLVFKEEPKQLEKEIVLANEEEPEVEETEQKESVFKEMVRALTREDVASGKYTIFDIVLSLPGFDITYPSNEIGKQYEELLAIDGLSSEKLKGKHRLFSLGGAYRKVFQKPIDLTWKFLKYSSDRDELINSDYSRMVKDPEIESKPDGDQTALVLEFSLPQSTYATMLLRELLKNDTSVETQIKMQKALKEESDLKRAAENDGEEVEAKKVKME